MRVIQNRQNLVLSGDTKCCIAKKQRKVLGNRLEMRFVFSSVSDLNDAKIISQYINKYV